MSEARDDAVFLARPAWLGWLFQVLGGLVLAALLFAIYRYLAFPGYFGHSEPNLVIRAWEILNGLKPLQGSGGEGFFFTPYGPTPYWWSALWAWMGGPTLAGSKLGGAAAALIALTAFTLHASRTFGRPALAPAIALFGTLLLMAGQMSYWTGPDPVGLVFAALGLAVAGELHRRQGPFWLLPVALGAIAGLAVNVKAHAAVAFLPLALLYLSRRRLASWALAGVAGLAVALLPFAFSVFSPQEYLGSLARMGAQHPFEAALLKGIFRRLALFLLPLALLPLAWKNLEGRERAYALGYGLMLVVLLYPAGVSGSGWYQYVPLLPLAADLTFRTTRALEPKKGIAVFLAMVALAVASAWVPYRTTHRAIQEDQGWLREASDEIARVLKDHPGRIVEMGFGRGSGRTYHLTFLRPLLVHAGQPATFDGWADMEMAYIGVPPSPAKLARVGACDGTLWLIPKGEKPFEMPNYFSRGRDFLAPYQEAFLARHRLVERRKLFDLWSCEGGAVDSAPSLR